MAQSTDPVKSSRRARTSGEGSLRLRKDGRWEGRYYAIEDGAPVRRSVFGATDKDAARALRAATTARDDGKPAPHGGETVGAFLLTWLESARSTIRSGTWRRYEQLTRLYLVPTLGRGRLIALGPQHVAKLYRDLLAGGMSPANVHYVHRTLRRALGQAERWKLVSSNAAAVVTPPRAEQREMHTLTAEQVRRLLEVAPDRDRPLYLLAVSTGMRQGELLALRWADVDLNGGSLRVVATLHHLSGEAATFDAPKTARSRRRVELSESVVVALSTHKVATIEERWRSGQLWQDHNLVFPNLLGRPRGPSNVSRDLHQVLERAGLPRIRFHDLRHTAATLMLGRGVHPKLVSDMLGHASIGITLDTYSHSLPSMHREAAQVMEALLSGS
jgi:integrase